MSRDEPTTVRQPTDCPLNNPAMAIASEASSILRRLSFATAPVRADQFDPATSQSETQPVRISRSVVDQSLGPLPCDLQIDQCFDRIHFGNTGRNGQGGEGQTTTVSEQHDLCPLPAFRATNFQSPFFADENVPSAITCSNFNRFRRSRVYSKRFHASARA